ncbi:MAG: arginase family protein [Betaproteobacteria bacterium]|nr:arginase family protein [Betaproteobacteria bacterium]MCL2162414.1 arginase family protein [Betaproteobacteria bacterium]
MNENLPPLVLDLDGSLRAMERPGLARIDLTDWQERVRFGCTRRDWRAFSAHLDALFPDVHGPVLMGSGDFHHVSAFLIARQRRHAGLHVLVCDNHPDNMRFPFGIHCGSWVAHVARMPHVACVDVVGICSPDVGWAHAWENHLWPLFRGRVRYWTIGAKLGWMRALREAARNFDDVASLVRALRRELSGAQTPLYLSIDKDVLSESVARTNWDQGRLLLDDLLSIIDAAAPRIKGSDITGEVSIHRYRTRWKRWLSSLDGQPDIDPDDLIRWQRQQIEVNGVLLDALVQSQVEHFD